LKLGQQDEAARILGTIIEPMLAAREDNDVHELVNELLARNPEHVPGLRLLARLHWWQRDMDKLRGVLERLAEAAEALGLVDEERYALTQLVRLTPEEHHYFERLALLGGSLEEREDTANLMGDPEAASVPAFETFNLNEADTASLAEPKESFEFEFNSVDDSSASPAVSFADLNEPEDSVEAHALTGSSELISGDSFASALDSPSDNGQAVAERVQDEKQDSLSVEAMMRQELESVDFYIKQGYHDIAFDTLELLERQFGNHPDIDSRRIKLQAGDQKSREQRLKSVAEPANEPRTSDTEVLFGEVQIEQPSETAKSAPVSVRSGIDSGLAEIFEEFRMEAEGESPLTEADYETHFNMATAYKEMDLLDEAIREFQLAARLTTPTDGTTRYFQCCNMLGLCFVQKGMAQAAVIWFRKALEVPGRNAEESKALQYELGSAYEQMGDLVNAVAAFTEVYGVDVSYRDIAERLSSLQQRAANQRKGK
jgi:tetratricopeptide (TPR) repeat protein